MSNKIPTNVLFCTTVLATACSKSNEKIAQDICELQLCEATSEERQTYADEFEDYLGECISEGVEYIESAEGDCADIVRKFYLCVSELSCEQYENIQEEDGLCSEEMKAWFDCDNAVIVIEESFSTDQYEPDNEPSEASEINVGESQERTLHDGDDQDFVTFSIEEGKTYTIETLIEQGENTDTNLILQTLEYEYIDENDDKLDGDTYESFLEWTAPTTGTYLIEVTTLTPGPYVLRLTENG